MNYRVKLRIGSHEVSAPYYIKDLYYFCKSGARKKEELKSHFGNISETTLRKYIRQLTKILDSTAEALIVEPDPQDGGRRNSEYIYYITDQPSIVLTYKINNQIHIAAGILRNEWLTNSFKNMLNKDDPAIGWYELAIEREREADEAWNKALE